MPALNFWSNSDLVQLGLDVGQLWSVYWTHACPKTIGNSAFFKAKFHKISTQARLHACRAWPSTPPADGACLVEGMVRDTSQRGCPTYQALETLREIVLKCIKSDLLYGSFRHHVTTIPLYKHLVRTWVHVALPLFYSVPPGGGETMVNTHGRACFVGGPQQRWKSKALSFAGVVVCRFLDFDIDGGLSGQNVPSSKRECIYQCGFPLL